MRFTLEQLENIVPKILKAGKINNSFEGYPMLHSVAIELRDERDKSKHARYFKLIERILEHPGCDVDIFDKHKRPLLGYAAQEGNVKLLELLLEYRANPNLIDGSGYAKTPLEWAIFSGRNANVINILNPITRRTAKMQKNAKELFERALEEEEIPWINSLLDLELVHYEKKFRKGYQSIPDFKDGIWIRSVTDPEREYEILRKRNCWEDIALARLRHQEMRKNDPYYTPYSPATFVRPGIPISLFDSGAGVMIRPSQEPIAYWYDGHSEELTREMSYSKGSKLSNGRMEGQHHEVTAEKIKSVLEAQYLQEYKKCGDLFLEDPEAFDKHGVLLDRMLCDNIHFSWNEGLLRYKFKDIVGIHVNPHSKQSCIQALELREKLKVKVPLYYYSERIAGIKQISSADLIEKWQLGVVNKNATAVNDRVFLPSGGPCERKKQVSDFLGSRSRNKQFCSF